MVTTDNVSNAVAAEVKKNLINAFSLTENLSPNEIETEQICEDAERILSPPIGKFLFIN